MMTSKEMLSKGQTGLGIGSGAGQLPQSGDVDLFEEFEFRPLTEGLGFHRKPTNKSASPGLTSPSTSVGPQLRSPLPRKKSDSEKVSLPPMGKTTGLLQSFKTRNLDFENSSLDSRSNSSAISPSVPLPELGAPKLRDRKSEAKSALAPEPLLRNSLTTANYDPSALILDGMLLMASFLTCLIVLLMVTKVDLMASLTSSDSGKAMIFNLGVVYVILTWMYLVLNRIFLGCTPGEWVFDQRLGKQEQFGSTDYMVATLLRSTTIVLTGLVLFPILSLVLGYDVLGRWLNLELSKSI